MNSRFSNHTSIPLIGIFLSSLLAKPKEIIKKETKTVSKEISNLIDILVQKRDLSKKEIFVLIKTAVLKTLKENNKSLQFSDISLIRNLIEKIVKEIYKSNINETIFKTHFILVYDLIEELNKIIN